MIRVTVWNEYRHERTNPQVAAIYPEGIHGAIAQGLAELLGKDATIHTATQDQPDHGLGGKALDQTDVLLWWGHVGHDDVDAAIVDRVQRRVLDGMGLIVLHSAHYSKPFRRLMGTGCGLKWRESGEMERVWVVNPGHPIADGLSEYFELPETEMYGELFDIPQPDALVLLSWFEGGEVFRSGCCFSRGKGSIFYFGPGHETYPIYYDPNVRRVLANAVRWAAPSTGSPYQYPAVQAKTPPHKPRSV